MIDDLKDYKKYLYDNAEYLELQQMCWLQFSKLDTGEFARPLTCVQIVSQSNTYYNVHLCFSNGHLIV